MYRNSSISAISSYGWSNFEKCFSFKTQRFLPVFLRWKVSMSFLSFCFCRNSILSFILNDSTGVYGILGWQSSFSALWLCDLRAFQLQYCVIASCVEYVVSYFPHWLKTFSLCLSCLWAVFLWCDWVWFSWNASFLNLIDCFGCWDYFFSIIFSTVHSVLLHLPFLLEFLWSIFWSAWWCPTSPLC